MIIARYIIDDKALAIAAKEKEMACKKSGLFGKMMAERMIREARQRASKAQGIYWNDQISGTDIYNRSAYNSRKTMQNSR